MQVVGAAAMEPPGGADPKTIKDALVLRLPGGRSRRPGHYVRGQYDGYLDIDGVTPDSTTETFAALRLDIDNWRWAERPGLHPHRQASCRSPDRAQARLPPPAAAALLPAVADARAEPDRRQARSDDRDQADRRRPPGGLGRNGARRPRPRVRRPGWRGADALRGPAARGPRRAARRFTRQDQVEEAWRIFQPLLDAPPPVHRYETRAAGDRRPPACRARPTGAGTTPGWQLSSPTDLCEPLRRGDGRTST